MPLPTFFERFRSRAPATGQSSLSASDIEQARTRARRRMMGMTVLVVAAVALLSWLLAAEPRPTVPDIRIASSTLSAELPPAVLVTEPAPRPALHKQPPAQISETLAEGEEVVEATVATPSAPPRTIEPTTASESAAKAAAKPAAVKPASKPVAPKQLASKLPTTKPSLPPKPVVKPPAKAAVNVPAVTASSTSAASSTRYVVQVGAFTDVTAARATRLKVEALGLKTYTQVVQTPAGRKIRVRLGPFASEAEAQRALTSVRKAGVIGGILTL